MAELTEKQKLNLELFKKYFADETAKLDLEIKSVVLDIFRDYVPTYFWNMPASSTGRYHPQVVNSLGGLVKHTKLACWVLEELIISLHGIENVTSYKYYNEAVAAILLHDIFKFGSGEICSYEEARDHGANAALPILNHSLNNESTKLLAIAVCHHMGKWSPIKLLEDKFNEDELEVISLVQLADYIASRPFDKKYRELRELQVEL